MYNASLRLLVLAVRADECYYLEQTALNQATPTASSTQYLVVTALDEARVTNVVQIQTRTIRLLIGQSGFRFRLRDYLA